MSNRVIKFRGEQVNDEWCYGSLFLFEDGSANIFVGTDEEGFGRYYSINPETVGQFTGLLDKDGKEIFEDDIVLFADSEIYKIVYSDQKACFSLDGVGRFADIMTVIAEARQNQLTSLYNERFQVIGNIHEHLHLMEPK